MKLLIRDLGLAPYDDVWALQKELARQRIAGELAHDTLLLVQHPPVVTLGRSTKGDNLNISDALLVARGVERFDIERGGDATFHGPGQLVGYPIIDLRQHTQDLHWYLRQVEESLIVALAEVGLAASRVPKYTGVWIEDRKIASIGVHARDWVTRHGFALNVDTDLSYFDLFVPCGIANVVMTSTTRELGSAAPSLDAMKRFTTSAFGTVFTLSPVQTARAELELLLPVLQPVS